MNLNPGSLLQGGKYKIEQVLGQGGFGITYLGEQTSLGRKVAIKEFFMKELCNRDDATSQVSVGSEGSREMVAKFREKFVKEARNIAQLNHPNIVRVIDIFEENGTAYYAMEFCACGSLSSLLKEQYPLGMPEKKALKYIREVASALNYIHKRKMNHLDVKPGNIMLNQEDDAVLIDFGLSKQYDAQTGQQTSSTPVGISEGYAPMEQYKKGGVSEFSPSTDIYSLGATLYKLVTGQTPPSAVDLVEETLPDFEASPSVKAAVRAAMGYRRADRPQNIDVWLSMLDGNVAPKVGQEESTKLVSEVTVINPEPIVNPKPKSEPKPSAPKPQPKPASAPKAQATTDSSSNSQKKIILIVAAVAIVGVIVALFALCGGSEKEAVQAQAPEISQTAATLQPTSSAEAPTPTPEQASPVVEPQSSAAATMGYLTVTSSPKGATIYVDGKKVGKTPLNRQELKPGSHKVKVEYSGYEPDEKTMKVTAGEEAKWTPTLAKKEEPKPEPTASTSSTTTAPVQAAPASQPEEPVDNTIYTVVENQPVFPGGEAALTKFIAANLKYPAFAAENGIQGRVTLSFVVEKDGSIDNIEVMRSPADELSQEAIRVVNSMPKWKPGQQKGKPVRVKYVLPVTFRLQ